MSEKSTNTNTHFSGFDLSSITSGYSGLPKSAEYLMRIQNNNINAIKEIQSIMFSNMQEVSQRQTAVFSRIMEQTTLITNDISKEGRPEAKLAQNIDTMKASYEDAMASVKEISALVRKANERATKVLRKSAEENYKEGQSALSSASTSAGK